MRGTHLVGKKDRLGDRKEQKRVISIIQVKEGLKKDFPRGDISSHSDAPDKIFSKSVPLTR